MSPLFDKITIRTVPRRLAPLLFPVALWFLATFFLLGDLGKYNDDWFYLQRHAATGEIRSLYLDQPLQFWRPLYRLVVPSLMTLLWNADWLNHLISALAHGGVVVLLWRLLLLLGVPRPGAAVASLLFMVWPSYFEAVLWLCSLPTMLSPLLVLVACILHVRYARHQVGHWTVVAIPFLFFASACLNEQATTGLAALPFLYFAVRPADEPLARSLPRTAVPTMLAALALALYIGIHAALKLRPPVTDRPAFILPLAEMPSQAREMASWIKVQFTSQDFLSRAFSVGAHTLAEYPLRTAVVAIALAAGLVPWVRSLAPAPAPIDTRPRWIAIAGLAAFLAPLTPIVAFSYWHNPRLLYAPTLGLAILIGACAAAISSRLRLSSTRHIAIAGLAGAILVFPAIAMVGFQRGYQDRARRDADEAAQLKALIPDPPPGTVFVALRIDLPDISSRHAANYDRYYWSALGNWWSARWIVRSVYARDDLLAGDPAWTKGGILGLWPAHARVRNVGDVPIDLLIPFTIDRQSRISLVTELRSGTLVVPVPLTSHAARDRALPPHPEPIP